MLLNADPNAIDPVIARRELINQMNRRELSRASQLYAEAAFDATLKLTNDPETAIRAAVNATTDDSELAAKRRQVIIDAARADAPPTIRIEVVDQNQVSIPHRSEVNNVGQNSAGRGR